MIGKGAIVLQLACAAWCTAQVVLLQQRLRHARNQNLRDMLAETDMQAVSEVNITLQRAIRPEDIRLRKLRRIEHRRLRADQDQRARFNQSLSRRSRGDYCCLSTVTQQKRVLRVEA